MENDNREYFAEPVDTEESVNLALDRWIPTGSLQEKHFFFEETQIGIDFQTWQKAVSDKCTKKTTCSAETLRSAYCVCVQSSNAPVSFEESPIWRWTLQEIVFLVKIMPRLLVKEGRNEQFLLPGRRFILWTIKSLPIEHNRKTNQWEKKFPIDAEDFKHDFWITRYDFLFFRTMKETIDASGQSFWVTVNFFAFVAINATNHFWERLICQTMQVWTHSILYLKKWNCSKWKHQMDHLYSFAKSLWPDYVNKPWRKAKQQMMMNNGKQLQREMHTKGFWFFN